MDRASVEELVATRYGQQYNASLRFTYPTFHAQQCCGQTKAALGYRRGDAGDLFLEAYLEAPIEEVLRAVLGQRFERRDIVEIGNLASCNAAAMVALWAKTANDLGSDAEIAVAVLTAPLRGMFSRLGIKLTALAPANPSKLGTRSAEWGRYYEQDPIVCAGLIAEGQDRLNRFLARMERHAA